MLPAMCRPLCAFLILLLPLALCDEVVVQGSRVAEEDADAAPKLLRSQKVNAIWDKARKRISDEVKLKTLAGELETLDGEYMELKKAKIEDSNPLGESEAVLTAKTEAILHNYDLWDEFKDAHESSKLGQEPAAGRGPALRKLDSLVEKAQRAGFTEEELTDLREEIEHHKKKMDEYEQLRVEYEELERRTNRIPDSIEASGSTLREEHDAMRASLKEKHRNIRHGYEKLVVLSESPTVQLKDIGFTDPKLIRLWAEALKANFTVAELQSLKVELSHLQEKMLKHQALKEEASLVKKKLKKKQARDGGKEPPAAADEALREAADRHEQLSDEAEEYGHTVKKYVRDIKNKIKDARLRTEL